MNAFPQCGKFYHMLKSKGEPKNFHTAIMWFISCLLSPTVTFTFKESSIFFEWFRIEKSEATGKKIKQSFIR